MGNGRPPRRPRPLLLRRNRPDLLLVGGVTVPPSNIRDSSPPPPSPCLKGPLLLVRKVYCCVGRTGSDVVDVVISSRSSLSSVAPSPSPSSSHRIGGRGRVGGSSGIDGRPCWARGEPHLSRGDTSADDSGRIAIVVVFLCCLGCYFLRR
jgi:hypothetical protein